MPAVPGKTASLTAALFQVWKLTPLYQSAVVVFQVPVPPLPGVMPSASHSKALAPWHPAKPNATAAVPSRRYRLVRSSTTRHAARKAAPTAGSAGSCLRATRAVRAPPPAHFLLGWTNRLLSILKSRNRPLESTVVWPSFAAESDSWYAVRRDLIHKIIPTQGRFRGRCCTRATAPFSPDLVGGSAARVC